MNEKEKKQLNNETIIISLGYSFIFIGLLFVAIKFKEVYWYYLIGVSIFSIFALLLYLKKRKAISS